MKRFKGAQYLLGLALLFGVSGGLFGSQAVLADQLSSQSAVVPAPNDDSTDTDGEEVQIFSTYPILQNTPDSTFRFEVTLYYEGDESKTFDLDFVVPEGWAGIFSGGYPEAEISAFTVRPGRTGEKIYLTVGSISDTPVEPGEYTITVNASSGDIEGSADFKAVVIPQPEEYYLYLSTATLLTEFSVTPEQENHISMQLTNGQIGRVEDIVFDAEEPEGWQVTFTPDSIPVLESGVTQEIDMVVVPPKGAEPGDYPLVLKAIGDKTETSRSLRISVASSAMGGMAGVIVTIAVVVVLAIWFRRSGNR